MNKFLKLLMLTGALAATGSKVQAASGAGSLVLRSGHFAEIRQARAKDALYKLYTLVNNQFETLTNTGRLEEFHAQIKDLEAVLAGSAQDSSDRAAEALNDQMDRAAALLGLTRRELAENWDGEDRLDLLRSQLATKQRSLAVQERSKRGLDSLTPLKIQRAEAFALAQLQRLVKFTGMCFLGPDHEDYEPFFRVREELDQRFDVYQSNRTYENLVALAECASKAEALMVAYSAQRRHAAISATEDKGSSAAGACVIASVEPVVVSTVASTECGSGGGSASSEPARSWWDTFTSLPTSAYGITAGAVASTLGYAKTAGAAVAGAASSVFSRGAFAMMPEVSPSGLTSREDAVWRQVRKARVQLSNALHFICRKSLLDGLCSEEIQTEAAARPYFWALAMLSLDASLARTTMGHITVSNAFAKIIEKANPETFVSSDSALEWIEAIREFADALGELGAFDSTVVNAVAIIREFKEVVRIAFGNVMPTASEAGTPKPTAVELFERYATEIHRVAQVRFTEKNNSHAVHVRKSGLYYKHTSRLGRKLLGKPEPK